MCKHSWVTGYSAPWFAGGEDRVIVNQVNSANSSLLDGYSGRRAARITKTGEEIVINGTSNNKYLRGIPNEAELARMGLRLKYNGPLKEEFKQLKFHDSNGANIRSQDFKTIVFEKVK